MSKKKNRRNTPKKRIMLIVNPKAGMKRKKANVQDIADYLAKNKYEVAIYFTSLEYGAEFLTTEHAGDFDIVACCGGDGTVNECVRGLVKMKKKPELGYIPAGSTNDLANSLDLPKNAKRAAKTIITEKALPFDIGSFDDGWFVYIASFGAFTELSYNTPQKAKNIFGHAAYMLGVMRSMRNIRTHHVRIEADGEIIEGDYIFGAVMNSTSIAGTFRLDDELVDFSDGKYELLLIKHPKTLGNAIAVSLSMMNKTYRHELITLKHASEFIIETDEPLDWALDGERRRGGQTVRIHNNKHAVSIIRKNKN